MDLKQPGWSQLCKEEAVEKEGRVVAVSEAFMVMDIGGKGKGDISIGGM